MSNFYCQIRSILNVLINRSIKKKKSKNCPHQHLSIRFSHFVQRLTTKCLQLDFQIHTEHIQYTHQQVLDLCKSGHLLQAFKYGHECLLETLISKAIYSCLKRILQSPCKRKQANKTNNNKTPTNQERKNQKTSKKSKQSGD